MRMIQLLCLLFPLFSFAYEVIEDTCALTLLNPAMQEQKRLKLRLSNGMKVLLISDPSAHESAAAMRIGAGSLQDPEKYPGMAHLTEHLLFQGTETYPDENLFNRTLSDYQGHTNAFTAPNRTVYGFASQEEGFLDLLDQFSHFFIDPLFSHASIDSELNAVNEEHAKNLQNDAWREHMVLKEQATRGHPAGRFSTGSAETLSSIPKEALQEWVRKCYGAERMCLVLYSSLPIETLQEVTVRAFSRVPLAEASLDSFPHSFLSQAQKGGVAYVESIREKRTLSLSFELSSEWGSDEAQSAELIAFALQRAHPDSLLEVLKNKGYVEDVAFHVSDLFGKKSPFFEVQFELKEKGKEHIPEVLSHLFASFREIARDGLPPFLFEEKKQLGTLFYAYQDLPEAFDYAGKLADLLGEEDLASFPQKSMIATEFAPEKIKELARLFTPDACYMSYLAPSFSPAITLNKKEKWMQVPYALEKLPSAWKEASMQDPSPLAAKLPPPNPFIPTDWSLVPDSNQTPYVLTESEMGKLFYCRASEFQMPEASLHLHIRSQALGESPKHSLLKSLFLDLLSTRLAPTLASAKEAGLSARLSYEKDAVTFEVTGFSEKAPFLMRRLTEEMQPPFSPAEIEDSLKRHKKALVNKQKELPLRQAEGVVRSLLYPWNPSPKAQLEALGALSVSEVVTFQKDLLKNTYLEGFFAGNLKEEEAASLWLDLAHTLYKAPFSPPPKPGPLALKEGPYMMTQETDVAGGAALLLIDGGPLGLEQKAAQEILMNPLKEAFFDELRSKQKTGYIVYSRGFEVQKELYTFFAVQSSTHQPLELLFRFEQFLENYLDALPRLIPEERFERLKQSAAFSLQNQHRTLSSQTTLFDHLAFQKEGRFSYVQERQEAIKSLSYEQFLDISKKSLSRDNKKRLACLFEGKVSKPFAYQPIGPSRVEEVVLSAP